MKLCRLILTAFVVTSLYCLVLLSFIYPLVAFFVGLFLCARFGKRTYQYLTACGTARWADENDMRRAGMLDADSGLIVGRATFARPTLLAAANALFNFQVESARVCAQFFDALGRNRNHQGPLVQLPNAIHTAIFAPTGVGKGVSCVIPFLQTCDESCVCVDFKGELTKLTAEQRQAMGHKVVILDPFKVVTSSPDTFNALDFINKDEPLSLDDCRDLAEALTPKNPQAKEPHWEASSEAWIAAMIAVVVYFGQKGDRSLQTVRTLLSNPEKLEATIKLMCSSDAWAGMLERMGHQLRHYKGDELGSVLTTTNRFLRFLDTMAILENTKASSFDPAELRTGKMTVYLVLPPEHMRAQSALLRMWIAALLRACVRGGLRETNKVHFVLDEAASLGKMEALDDAVDKYRGYAVRLQFYYQSIGQLKKCWPEGGDQTLLSNCAQVFFGVNDVDTATYVSTRLGEETILVDSGGTNSGWSQQANSDGSGSVSRSGGRNANWGQQARKLLKPEEVLALSPRTAITFTPDIPPLWTTLVRYYEEKNLGQRPGWFQRLWEGTKMLAWSAAALAAAIMVAVAVTKEHPKIASNISALIGERR